MVVAGRLSDAGCACGARCGVIATYVLQTCGELCLSPVGLFHGDQAGASALRLAHDGIWFFAFFVFGSLLGHLAGWSKSSSAARCFHMMGGQADFFLMFVVVTLIAGVALFALSGPVKRLMREGREVVASGELC